MRLERACAIVFVMAACRSASVEPRPSDARLPAGAEAWSLAGEALYAPPLAADERAKREEQLAAARAEYERNPGDADATVWFGRRLGYLGRFREAVEVFTRGIAEHPDDARMYRHRGHRYVTLRHFELAAQDLERAAQLVRGKPDEVEPDLAANPSHPPLETLQSNIYYHLGLAHYLLGHFERARAAYIECRRVSLNPDNLCSVTHWLYMTLRRLGREAEAREVVAPITADMQVVEYHAYHQLCLAYAGKLDIDAYYEELQDGGIDTVDFATGGYGVGNWLLYNGERERALAIFRAIAGGAQWHAFGHVAAETELARPR